MAKKKNNAGGITQTVMWPFMEAANARKKRADEKRKAEILASFNRLKTLLRRDLKRNPDDSALELMKAARRAWEK